MKRLLLAICLLLPGILSASDVQQRVTGMLNTSVQNWPTSYDTTGSTINVGGTVSVNCISGCSGSSSSSAGVSTVTFNGTAQPITLTNVATTTISGTVPVSGSFYQVTQPVSGTFWQSIQPVSISSVGVSGSTVNVNVNGTVPVSGTFWQATQPVYISSVSVGGSTVSVSNFPASQAVTGTFFQATQPVSGNMTASISGSSNTVQISGTPTVSLSGISPVSASISGSSNTVQISGTPTVSVSGTPTVSASISGSSNTVQISGTPSVTISGTPTISASISGSSNTVQISGTPAVSQSGTWTATPPSITKAAQGSTGFTTQDLKDAGRSYVVLVATGVAGVTSEALFSFAQNKQGARTEAVTSYTVTNGKTLRIQGLYCSNRDATTTIAWTRAVLRHNTGGATTITSPMIAGIEVGGAAALAGSTGYGDAPFPDGIEIFGNGTQSIGVSHLDQATGNLVTCTLVGYEY